MTKRLVMGGAVGVFVAASVYVGAAGPQEPPGTTAPIASHPQGALLAQYCVGCHNQRAKVGNFTLDQLDLSKVGEEAETWEKVVLKLNAGLMPPPGNRRPSPEAHRAFLTWLESELDTAARLRPNAGRPETFHRLNRFEYGNAVRDLLDLEVDVETLLPTDDAGYGFDNIAGVLKLSQSLMERYMSAARKISRRAVGSVAPPMVLDTFRVSSERRQYERVEGLPFGTRGGLLIPYYFPRDGEYSIRATFICNFSQGGFCDGTNSYEDSHQLEVTIDGERVHLFDLEKRPARRYEDSHSTADGTEWEVRVPVKAGEREVGVTFLKLPFYETSTFGRLPFQGPAYEGNMVPAGLGVYQPYLEAVTIGGPYEPTGGPGDTASWRRIFTCWPASAAEDAACAKAILSQLARRAYRRPVTEKDVQALLVFYEEAREAGGPFELGVETGLRALLVSPSFVFRVERDPSPGRGAVQVAASTAGAPAAGAEGVTNYRLSDLDLASRLSFFLWSSIPDEELLEVAARGRLSDPATLEQQVRRMLADPRSAALSTNFLPQWLQIRGLEFVAPADPNFDETLRDAMRTETELFFDSFIRDDRPVPEMLTANYTFLNERLAWHYGIPEVKGSHFRRVPLPDDSPYRGLLGQASILTVTSHAIRTSPVKRGKWILSSILGVEPPPPPPVVPELDEGKDGVGSTKPKTIRERMAAHRENPTCAGCHRMIDPVGFALENFDPTGKYRVTDETMQPIDVTGEFPDGTEFRTLAEFKAALVSEPEQFVRAFTERLLTYAVGRGLEYYDRPAIRGIAREAAADYRFSAVVLGIVKSVPFQMRRALNPAPAQVAAVR